MNLENYLMPVIPTVNDLASVEGDVDHPNGSLLCEKFNNFVTEVFSKQIIDSIQGNFTSRFEYQFSQGFFIPQNSAISIQFPDNSRIVDYTMVLVLLDPTFLKAVARFDECLIFGSLNFSPLEDTSSVSAFGTFNSENILFNWIKATSLNLIRGNDNSNVVNRTVSNNGEGGNLGFVIDNCYPTPITGFIKFTSISS